MRTTDLGCRMKVCLAAFLALFALSAVLKAEIEKATPAQFAKLMEEEGAVLVDVRSPQETKQGKLEGALEFDFYANAFAEAIQTLPRDKTLLLYCRSGNRSGQAAALLHSKGYKKLVNLDGGILAWRAASLPLNSK